MVGVRCSVKDPRFDPAVRLMKNTSGQMDIGLFEPFFLDFIVVPMFLHPFFLWLRLARET